MFDNIENLKLSSSTRDISKKFSVMQNRKIHAFNIRLSGSVAFTFGGRSIEVNKGEMIFLPRGSSYELKTLSESESSFMSISFDADISCPQPAVFSLDNFSDTYFLCNHFTEMLSLGSQSDKYKCYSFFYGLLAYISNIEHASYSEKRKYDTIEPALEYMKSHLYDTKFKIDKLHLLCGISDTYFRKIFTSRFGTTPQNYVINKRISRAESIISEGNFDTISEVAEAVGYTDPLYFSRAFKKKYGVSPSNMNKEILEEI